MLISFRSSSVRNCRAAGGLFSHLRGLVCFFSCVYLFLLMKVKPSSVGDGDAATPGALPYLEINEPGGEKIC